MHKIKKYSKKSVLVRVICGLIFPILLVLQHVILPLFEIDFDNIPTFVIILVGAILYGLLITADITVRNIPLIITLNVIGLLLFFPICLLVSAFVSWISKIFIFIAAAIVIFLVLFFHGDRTNP